MPKPQDDKLFYFEGFLRPNFTQVPNPVIDQLMPILSEAEFKVLMYIVRRTFGFDKDYDAISLSQMTDGITTRDGRVLDKGTGLSKSSVRRGVSGLQEKGVIVVRKVRNEDGEYETNVYSLRFQDEEGVGSEQNNPPVKFEQGVGPERDYPGSMMKPGVGQNSDIQQKAIQQKEQQDGPFEISKDQPTMLEISQVRADLEPYIRDFARELRDQSKLSSSVTRAVNIYFKTDLELDDFIDVMMTARKTTQNASASIRATDSAESGLKFKMPYFFSVLENLLGVGKGNTRKVGAAD